MKKITSIILAGAMLASMASCGEKKTQTDVNVNMDSPYLVSKEPVNLSIHLHFAGGKTYDEDLPVFKRASELTNVFLENSSPEASSNSAEAYDLMLASNDIPDIVAFVNRNKFMEDGMEGAYIPLDDLIEEHAPNIKAFFDKYPDAKKASTAPDGHIYGISCYQDQEVKVGMAWFLRLDWLKKLGLEVPETKDELHNVLLAFLENDPNGNGVRDEVPFFTRGRSTGALMPLWGAFDGFFVEDGVVKYGPVEEEFKTAMKEIQQWYKEGVIDQEIFTRDANVRDVLLSGDKGGCTSDWISSTSAYNNLFKDKVPGLDFSPIAPPATDDGRKLFYFSREIILETGWGITHTNPNPVETIKYFDFWFSKEGSTLMNYGIEGEDYTVVDGQPTYTQKALNSGVPLLNYLEKRGAIYQGIGFPISFEYERQAMSDAGRDGIQLYLENDYVGKNNLPPLNFMDDEQERFNKIRGDILTYFAELQQRWTMGEGDVDAEWDNFVATVNKLGLKEILEIQQAAYDRFSK